MTSPQRLFDCLEILLEKGDKPDLGYQDIQLTDALAGVVKRNPYRRTLPVGDLGAGDVGHKHGLSSH